MINTEKLEIRKHDGPGRIGKLNNRITPLITNYNKIKISPEEKMPYNLDIELVEWALDKHLEKTDQHLTKADTYAVIQGSKYIEKRIECAQILENQGYSKFIIANSDELLRRPKDLVKLIIKIRETINPNNILCFPFAESKHLPLLTYMGIDMYTDTICEFYSNMNIIMTQTSSYKQETYKINDLNPEELYKFNKNIYELTLNEIISNMQNGTLRNMVERYSGSDPLNKSMLRILDKEYNDYLNEYTQLY